MELEELRARIRAVDEEMAALFVRRMEVSAQIAAYKRAHGLPVEDRAQEARVLAGRGALVSDDALRPYYLDFLQGTMELSKRRQRALNAADGTLRVSLGAVSYDVVLRCGCLAQAGALLFVRRRVLIVTDAGVPARYAEALAAQCASPLVVTVPEGERCKTPAVLQTLLEAMLRAGFTRGDCVCAVGGGAVGDLAGLAAALYMRGVDFYNVPTTLLAQADSAVNGQEAVDAFLRSPEGHYDLILMDIQMPVMDGYTAVQRIRESKREDAPTVKIIAMTANAFAEDIAKALNAGMNGHLAKPIDINMFMQTLRQIQS